jgi:hypothetical protein
MSDFNKHIFNAQRKVSVGIGPELHRRIGTIAVITLLQRLTQSVRPDDSVPDLRWANDQTPFVETAHRTAESVMGLPERFNGNRLVGLLDRRFAEHRARMVAVQPDAADVAKQYRAVLNDVGTRQNPYALVETANRVGLVWDSVRETSRGEAAVASDQADHYAEVARIEQRQADPRIMNYERASASHSAEGTAPRTMMLLRSGGLWWATPIVVLLTLLQIGQSMLLAVGLAITIAAGVYVYATKLAKAKQPVLDDAETLIVQLARESGPPIADAIVQQFNARDNMVRNELKAEFGRQVLESLKAEFDTQIWPTLIF